MLHFETQEIKEFVDNSVPEYQRDLLFKAIEENTNSMEFFDELGRELTGEKNSSPMLLATGPTIAKESFWDKVKNEVYIFICTSDKKYKKERNLIGKNFKEVATIIATAIAGSFSVGIGVVIGIITNILISIIKVNQNAWCELQKDKM